MPCSVNTTMLQRTKQLSFAFHTCQLWVIDIWSRSHHHWWESVGATDDNARSKPSKTKQNKTKQNKQWWIFLIAEHDAHRRLLLWLTTRHQHSKPWLVIISLRQVLKLQLVSTCIGKCFPGKRVLEHHERMPLGYQSIKYRRSNYPWRPWKKWLRSFRRLKRTLRSLTTSNKAKWLDIGGNQREIFQIWHGVY